METGSELSVRPFRKEDVASLLRLMKGLAVFEGYIDDFAVTEQDLIDHGLCETPRFGAFVVERHETGELVGTAVHYVVPWTYDMKPKLVLKELYVAEEARGTGAGRLLMEAIAGEAARIGASKVAWTVLDGNERAERFYSSIGGKPDSIWNPWFLDSATIRSLASRNG